MFPVFVTQQILSGIFFLVRISKLYGALQFFLSWLGIRSHESIPHSSGIEIEPVTQVTGIASFWLDRLLGTYSSV